MVKVRKVVHVTAPEPVREEVVEWIPPNADDWQPPFKPLPLCSWVPPKLNFKLPCVTVDERGHYVESPCEVSPCPCAAAKRYAVQKPENIWRHT